MSGYQQQSDEYTSTGWGAMSDTKSDSGNWLDCKQGQGDTHVVRIIEVHGIRMKSFRGGRPNKHLEMSLELWESNGEKFDEPQIVKTNPRASWCGQIRKESERLAAEAGWDGDARTFGKYANEIGNYYLRLTRNDDPNTNRGYIDVENLGHIDDQGDDTGTAAPAATNNDPHIAAINGAESEDDLRAAFSAAFTSTNDPAQRAAYKAAYDQQKALLSDNIPF